MASSGTAVFTLTRDQMIGEAYRKARVTAEGQAPSALQISEAASRLNMIIKNCMSSGLPLWTYEQYRVRLVEGQIVYRIGGPASEAMPDNTRPLRVVEYGNFLRYEKNDVRNDTPLRLISRQEYMNYGNKHAPGIVNAIYYDSKIDTPVFPFVYTSPGIGYGSLYVYVAPGPTTLQDYEVWLNGQRPLYDMNTGTDEFDFPSEWFMYLMYALAAEILDDNEGSEQRIARLENKAATYREKLMDWSVETASSSFAPQVQGY